MKKRSFFWGCLLVVCLLTCSRALAQVRLAISVADLDQARSIAVASDVMDHARSMGYEIHMDNANGKKSRQILGIERLLEKKPTHLVIVSAKSIGLSEVIAKAAEEGVKVLLVDHLSSDANPEDVLANISIDAAWAGSECAHVLAEYFDGAPAKILEVQGTAGSWNTYRFTRGFRDTLCDYPNMQIFSVLSETNERQSVQQKLLKLLESLRQDEGFDAIFCHGDEGGIGAVNASLSASASSHAMKDIPIVMVGGSADVMRALAAGMIHACVYITPYFGQAVVETIEKDLAGEAVEHDQLVRGCVLYTQDASVRGY